MDKQNQDHSYTAKLEGGYGLTISTDRIRPQVVSLKWQRDDKTFAINIIDRQQACSFAEALAKAHQGSDSQFVIGHNPQTGRRSVIEFNQQEAFVHVTCPYPKLDIFMTTSKAPNIVMWIMANLPPQK